MSVHHPRRYQGLIEQYRERLPIEPDTRPVSIGEGNTPLIELERIPGLYGREVQVFAKFEGMNPTGSFKDRGMTMAVTRAREEGSHAVICASTGNTSASAAAYASRADMASFVLIPEGKIALGKLAQASMHGARVIQIKGNFDAGMRLVKQLAGDAPVTLVNSVNPYRLQGQKTIAFEVVDALGRAPDYHCLPVGNAGNISAHWIGYSEYAGIYQTASCTFCDGDCRFKQPAVTDRRPVMLGYQASGAAPFLRGAPVAEPDTVATAIRIGSPQSWSQAQAAVDESGGRFAEVSDEQILAAQKLLADHEGIFCEPASAASVAGLIEDLKSGGIEDGALVVCTLTGHGLKDPDIAIAQSDKPVTVEADREAIKRIILDNL
ncbi:MAG TPA: threonine synthase [Arenicellales bacterium]|nr:threonine synthase [Arenicellales bacterium]